MYKYLHDKRLYYKHLIKLFMQKEY